MKAHKPVLIMSLLVGLFIPLMLLAQEVTGPAFNVLPSLPNQAGVRESLVSPDGRFVFYIADQDTDGVNELYQVPISRSNISSTKLNSALVSGGNVDSFEISPDSSRVVYRADQDTDGETELYSVAITGGQVEKLNDEVPSDRDVLDAQISADSKTVVYRADHVSDRRNELFSVPIQGGEVTRLSTNLTAINQGNNVTNHENVSDFNITPDNAFVVFMAQTQPNNRIDLFSVPIQGGEILRISPDPQQNGGQVSLSGGITISPDSARVLFVGDLLTDNNFDLFSVGIRGGDVIELSFIDEVNLFAGPQISPDSSSVIFQERVVGAGVSGPDLVQVAIDRATEPEIISPEIEGATSFFNPVLSADGELLAFSTDIGEFVMSLSSGQVISLGGQFNSFIGFTADSQQILISEFSFDFTSGDIILRFLAKALRQGATTRTLVTFRFQGFDDGDDSSTSLSEQDATLVFSFFGGREIFAARLNDDDELCFPIRARNGSFTLVCL